MHRVCTHTPTEKQLVSVDEFTGGEEEFGVIDQISLLEKYIIVSRSKTGKSNYSR